jgi:hypothetical protein
MARNRPRSDPRASCDPARNLAKRETGDAGGTMIADRRAKEPRCRAAKPAVAAEHQDLCGGLVDDRERIALAVLGCDEPARELDHRVGHFLASRKLVDGGTGCAAASSALATPKLANASASSAPAAARTQGVVRWDGPE